MQTAIGRRVVRDVPEEGDMLMAVNGAWPEGTRWLNFGYPGPHNDFWVSPYGPTLLGNEEVTPSGSVNPVLEAIQ